MSERIVWCAGVAAKRAGVWAALALLAASLTGCTGMVDPNKLPKSGASSLQITTTSLPAAVAQSGYSAKLNVSGGVAPYIWITSGGKMPMGLTLNLPTGAIVGTPVQAGSYTFTTTVKDSQGAATSTTFSMVVAAAKPNTPASNPPSTPPSTPASPTTGNATPLQITTPALPVGAVKSNYSTTLSVTGGVPPYTWSKTAGSLPSGVTLGANGTVTGTPTVAGSYSFTTQVQDSQAATASTGFSMNVSTGPAPTISGVAPSKGSTNGGTAVVITGTNFQSGATVKFGTVVASGVSVTSAAQIQAIAPAQPTGTVNITVTAGDGQAATAKGAFTFVAAAPTGPLQQADGADAFVDSVGVNVHLHYDNSPYANFAAVEKSLQDLGVRHIRDGLVDTAWTAYYDRLNELGRAGIKSTLITTTTQSTALFTAYPSRVPDSFEAYEAPNEYDLSGDPNWATTLANFLGAMHSAIKGNSGVSRFPILGPSLTQPGSYTKVSSSAKSIDNANLHDYFGGRNPGTTGWGAGGYGSIAWNLALTSGAFPGKPVFTTETGYVNDTSNSQAVPENVSGRYVPRIFLEQWLRGIQRTFIYELVDIGAGKSDNGYGLLHSNFTPKPAYNALKSMLGLLADKGPSFQVGGLDYKLSGGNPDLQHLLLQKRDGRFFLVLWVEEPCYDMNTKKALPVSTANVTITLGQPARITTHSLDDSGNIQTTALGTGTTQTVEVSDLVAIVEISQ